MFKYQIIIFLVLIIGKCLCENEFLLQIPQGTLRGVQKLNRKHGIFYSFQKIPYAKPPVNELRFKEPIPAENWEGILDATHDLPDCTQDDAADVAGQEDCLYLNVYTPHESLSYPIIEPEGQTSFITKNPLTIIREGTYNHVPLIVGHNDAEGMGFHFVPLDEDPFLLNPTELRLERDSEEAVALLQKIYDFYFNGTKPTLQNNELSLINVYTDIYFAYPSIRLALEHVKTAKSPIYLYRFSADTKLNVYKRNDQTIAHYPGAAHGDELGYLFRTFIHDRIVRKITPGSVEDKAIDRITKLWTNFAKYGNPTPADFNEFQWKPVTSDTLNYIDFGTVRTVPGVNSDVDRMNFWHNAYFDSNLFTSEPLLISTSILKRLLFGIILFSSIYYIFRFY
ncbi:carboxylesterase [Holotrichia oblita]|uniref:Carboxylesterase n=1 Tax=Holotrichia oblita TaxID=644536 RepID=A0ACB9TPU3_HOLOL|nr:carboxylesterase [Holotrichia oblita]